MTGENEYLWDSGMRLTRTVEDAKEAQKVCSASSSKTYRFWEEAFLTAHLELRNLSAFGEATRGNYKPKREFMPMLGTFSLLRAAEVLQRGMGVSLLVKEGCDFFKLNRSECMQGPAIDIVLQVYFENNYYGGYLDLVSRMLELKAEGILETVVSFFSSAPITQRMQQAAEKSKRNLKWLLINCEFMIAHGDEDDAINCASALQQLDSSITSLHSVRIEQIHAVSQNLHQIVKQLQRKEYDAALTQAQDQLMKIESLTPSLKNIVNATLWSFIGKCHMEMRNLEESHIALNISLSLFPTLKALETLGDLLLKLQREAEAINCYSKAVKQIQSLAFKHTLLKLKLLEKLQQAYEAAARKQSPRNEEEQKCQLLFDEKQTPQEMAKVVDIDLNTCTTADVKHKFRLLALKYHPDKIRTTETKYCVEARYRQLTVIRDFLISRCKK